MRLKSLKLNGFKSFANPTTLTFKHPITAIVGPNGCGKSNVIDALRWVLGETSAKQLRGGAMSDVIFAGTDGKAGKSLASVELTFEHTQDEHTGIRHALNIYHELTLRRQITKDGKSDYFINGSRVRRRDVVDVFLGTGLGSRSYAVIEQGMIGRIIDADGARLREFIEEAAGVSRYQARKDETQKQLKQTQENLERLTDLQSELKKQHKTLSKQAKSAKEYERINDELKQLNKLQMTKRLFEAHTHATKTHSAQTQSLETLSACQKALNDVQNEFDKTAQALSLAQIQKDSTKEAHHQAQMALASARRDVADIEQKIRQYDHTLSRLKNTQKTTQEDITHAQNELNAQNEALSETAPKLTATKQALDDRHHQLKNTQLAHKEAQERRHALNSEYQTQQNEVALIKSAQERLQHAQAQWQKRTDTLNHERQALQTLEVSVAMIDGLVHEIETLNHAITALQDGDCGERLGVLSAQIKQHQNELVAHQKHHASLMGEYQTLQKLTHPKPQASAQTTAIDSDDHLPLLKEMIELSELGERYSTVLDGFLSFWLGGRIGQSNSMTDTAQMLLNQSENLSQNDNIHSALIPLQRLIKAPNLTLFDGVYLSTTDEMPQAKAGQLILTMSGLIVGSFGVLGVSRLGKKSDFLSQRLSHLKRLSALDDELNNLNQAINTTQNQLNALNDEYDALKQSQTAKQTKRQALSEQLHHAQKQLITHEAEQKNHALKQEMMQKQAKTLEIEKQEYDRQMQTLLAEFERKNSTLCTLKPKLESAKAEEKRLDEALTECQRALRACEHDLQTLTLNEQSIIHKLNHAKHLLDIANNNHAKASADIEAVLIKKRQHAERLPQKQQEEANAKQTATDTKAKSDEADERHLVLQTALHEHKQRLSHAQIALSQAQTSATQLQADLAVAYSRVNDLGAQMVQMDSGFKLDEVLRGFEDNPPIFKDHEHRLSELRQALNGLGAVNLMASAELSELEGRMSPMDTQIADIQKSMDKLKDAINTIDETTKSLFLQMLEAVNTELDLLFKAVFGGGQARLSLMNDDGLNKSQKWQAGLELLAQPKGKKNSRLAVLSGGEKTLTALCLVFAIFKQHPAPFCVLDEVDAPLDDANVGRFTSLIKELSQSVQFIFISHNKLAMQSAHELKGITMPTAGISSLVTVSLDEAWGYVDGGGA